MAAKNKKDTGGSGNFVLLVGDEGAVLIQMRKKQVVRRLFAQSPEPVHTRALEEALSSAPRAGITMLVDMMDQSYVRQTLPPVSSFSVGKIVKRRLDKDFSRDDIKGYLILDREKTGRRDWNYLMASLANPPLLQKWIAFAVERSNPLRGIGLVPLESQPFISAIARTFITDKGKNVRFPEWQILVSHHKAGGFRQVVLRNGKLIFTRMAQPIGESNPELIAGNIEQEMVNTLEYLKRMGLQDPATLSVIILAADDIKRALDPKSIKAGEYHFLTPYEMAEALSLTGAAQPEDHFGDTVISAFVGRRRRLILPLHTPYTRKLHNFSLSIMSLRAVSILSILSILVWAAISGWDIVSAQSDTETVLARQKVLKAQLDTMKIKAKALPVKIDLYTDTMMLAQSLDKRSYDMLDFVGRLAGTLQDDAIVKSYDWLLINPLEIKKGEDRRQINADIDLQLVAPQEPHEHFIAVAQALIERIKKAFPDYDVGHSELPGVLSDTKELKAIINDNGATPAGEGSNTSDIIKITIKGPLKKAEKNGH